MGVAVATITGILIAAAAQGRAGARPAAVGGRGVVRVRPQHGAPGAGPRGQEAFFPLVFSLFSFVLVANMLGMFPYFFTVTSHVVVTAALAVFVVAPRGGRRHRQAWARLVQAVRAARRAAGDPALHLADRDHLLPVAPGQPRPASVRQHAGRPHRAQGLRGLRGAASARWASAASSARSAPLAMAVALTALEFLVAFLQAFVFAILTCVYLNDALHPGH